LNERDHSIQQVARIVEENGAKILSLSVAPAENNLVEMHVKVNVPDLNPILQSLARFGYVVADQFQQDEFNHELKDRYDELMRYLNI
jgi:acetoin utilization protein AcuB